MAQQTAATARKLGNTVLNAPVSTAPVTQDLLAQGKALGQSVIGAVRPAIAAGDRPAFQSLYSTFQPQVAALRSQWQATEPSINPAPYAPFDNGATLRSSLAAPDGGLANAKAAYGNVNPSPLLKELGPAQESYNRIMGIR